MLFIVFDPLERFFSSVAIIALIFCSILYISKGLKRDTLDEKILMFGFASFWVSIALIRVYFYFTDFFLEGSYTGDLSTIFQTYSATHYIFLYFYLYLYIYVLVNVVSLSVMYIWFSIRSKKEFQAISSLMTIGFAVFLIGWAFEIWIIKSVNIIPPAVPSLFVLIGALVAFAPLIINLEFFSKRVANILVIISIGFILLFLSLTIFAVLDMEGVVIIIIVVAAFVLAIVVTYMIVLVIKSVITPSTAVVGLEKKAELKDFMKMFAKPQGFTEEEVAFHREKKICLVCKNKISRFNYVCPECDALYCIKCSNALADLENECWVCQTAFDESTALKAIKEPEKAIEIEDEIVVETGTPIHEPSHKNNKKGDPKLSYK